MIGWRAWRVARVGAELRLVSALRDDVWEPAQPLAASCARGHRAPDAACGCGVYAAAEATAALLYAVGRDEAWVVHRVVGEVELAGRIVEHERGWRGERAYPVRIWVPRGREDVVAGLAPYAVPVALDPESGRGGTAAVRYAFASASRPRPDFFAR